MIETWHTAVIVSDDELWWEYVSFECFLVAAGDSIKPVDIRTTINEFITAPRVSSRLPSPIISLSLSDYFVSLTWLTSEKCIVKLKLNKLITKCNLSFVKSRNYFAANWHSFCLWFYVQSVVYVMTVCGCLGNYTFAVSVEWSGVAGVKTHWGLVICSLSVCLMCL